MAVIKSCKTCGKEIRVHDSLKDRKNYCSWACRSVPTKHIKCQGCGKESIVRSKQKDKKFCSIECKKIGIYKSCPVCGKQFYTYPSRPITHCSVWCASSAGRVERICERCGNKFFIKKAHMLKKIGAGKYCSKTCRWPELPVTNCVRCGKEFRYHPYRANSITFCSQKCRDYNLTELDEKIRKSSIYISWRLTVFQRDNKQCTKCGSKKAIHAHHRVPFSVILNKYNIFSLDEAYSCDMLWDISNGITLCKSCHESDPELHLDVKDIIFK